MRKLVSAEASSEDWGDESGVSREKEAGRNDNEAEYRANAVKAMHLWPKQTNKKIQFHYLVV